MSWTGRRACHGCQKTDSLLKDCSDITAAEKKMIYEAIKRAGQVHAHVGAEVDEVQECLEGVTNVIVCLEEASIKTSQYVNDDKEFFDQVGFFQPSNTASGKTSARDPWAQQIISGQLRYESHKVGSTKVILRQNCNAGYKITNHMGY